MQNSGLGVAILVYLYHMLSASSRPGALVLTRKHQAGWWVHHLPILHHHQKHHINMFGERPIFGFWRTTNCAKYKKRRKNMKNRSLGGPSGPQLLVCGPSGLLDFVLCALWALRPCDPRRCVHDACVHDACIHGACIHDACIHYACIQNMMHVSMMNVSMMHVYM